VATQLIGPDWLDPHELIVRISDWLGPFLVLGVCLVIFAETGLMIGFFFPGDSLLFTLGMMAANQEVDVGLPVWGVCICIFIAAFVGDQTGYFIGRGVGPKVFRKPDSRLFKREYVDRTHAFFDKYGGRAIILSRFVPIVRTFTPVVAGVGKMPYLHFLPFSFLGALLWGSGVTYLGSLLGRFAFVQENIEYILIGIVLVSVLPMVFGGLKAKLSKKNKVLVSTGSDQSADATDN
jgi:membrane-associated protein